MPAQLSYPGVYIEELSSGVRTITGVATSVTAFIGRALSGPVNEPVLINNYGDYERRFGGLWIDSTLSYAVQDFYLNGGSQAIIVRVALGTKPAKIAVPGTYSPMGDFLNLFASSDGAWGNTLTVTIDHNTADPTAPPHSPAGSELTNFNLVLYANGVKVEEYRNVSLSANDTRFLPRVLELSSTRITVEKDANGNWVLPAVTRPAVTPFPIQGIDGSDGSTPDTATYSGSEANKTGLYALLKTDLFNLLSIPPPTRAGNTAASVYQAALQLCALKRAFLLVDPPAEWAANAVTAVSQAVSGLPALNLSGTIARNAAIYYPRVRKPDPLRENQIDTFVPSGIIAGLISQTDTNRGVWKSPAGIDVALNGIQGLQANLNDLENGTLNQLGINCLRAFPVTGRVVWGARTLRGADQLADEYKYIAVRRTALFLEESLYRGTQWVVFEPNDESLWAQIRLNIGAFMQNLFRQGAFQGKTPKEAYLVKCDKETTTQDDINRGVVNILVAFAPLKPAEFVVIQIQQLAGQTEN
ncbi:hypothetical protein SAMN05421788_107269 [Filimonas lacunae]|uniref:Tail sheath protein C-terminal domain-containing protein n=1 Tax=Filimonas lacunae TaxID=477680 RepID=A0A173MGR8_9BACT|nr:phage tail sheath C-terminal domain-containing protein [Filimonas lacunae]BAV06608.1 phage tail sheath protein FI [Filimonas lacunae]SIT27566.1 hypothetical protein SAMN05421788_107269 [Filimonas lacunae]